MSTIDEVAVVTSFNEAINAQDLDRLDRSVCSVAELDGPAEGRVVVRDALVDHWQV